AEAVLQHDAAGGGHETHLDHVAAGYLTVRQGLDDLPAVLAGVRRLADPGFGCITWKIHCVLHCSSGDALCRPGPPEPGRQLKLLQLHSSRYIEITADFACLGGVDCGSEDPEQACAR